MSADGFNSIASYVFTLLSKYDERQGSMGFLSQIMSDLKAMNKFSAFFM